MSPFEETRGKSMEYAAKHTFPKLIELYFVTREYIEAEKYTPELMNGLQQLMGEHVYVLFEDFTERVKEGIPVPKSLDEFGDFIKKVHEAENKYLQYLGEKSVDVIRSATKPTLQRIEQLSVEISENFEKAVGPGGVSAVMGQGKHAHYLFNVDLETQEELNKRRHYAEEEMEKLGISLDDLDLDKTLELRRRIDERLEEEKRYKEMKPKVQAKLAEYLVSKSQEIAGEVVESYYPIAKEALSDVKDLYTQEEFEELQSALDDQDVQKYIGAESRLAMISEAESILYNYIPSVYLEILRPFKKIGSLKIELDGEIDVDVDYILDALKLNIETRNQIIDALTRKSLEVEIDEATSEEGMYEVIKQVYKIPDNYKRLRSMKHRGEVAILLATLKMIEELAEGPEMKTQAHREFKLQEAIQRRLYGLREETLDNEIQKIWGGSN